MMIFPTPQVTQEYKGVTLYHKMDSQHFPSLVGFAGILGTLTLADINVIVAIFVGLASFAYLVIKIIKELKDGKD